jgi:hypothetical protein
MLYTCNAIFLDRNELEIAKSRFEIHHLVWFLHDRIKERNLNSERGQEAIILRSFKNNESVSIKTYSYFYC